MPVLQIESAEVNVGRNRLPGFLNCPPQPSGLVIFAHGSGSSRFSGRNRQVAAALNRVGMATLLFDLLSPEEEAASGRARVFDSPFLADRLIDAIAWCRSTKVGGVPVGLFGASTGAAAALTAAARLPDGISAVVSRGGRPDLAGAALEQVRAPTLFIVGSRDEEVLDLNRRAARRLTGLWIMEVVPGATHLFPEPGAMEKVTELATAWFETYLAASVT